MKSKKKITGAPERLPSATGCAALARKLWEIGVGERIRVEPVGYKPKWEDLSKSQVAGWRGIAKAVLKMKQHNGEVRGAATDK